MRLPLLTTLAAVAVLAVPASALAADDLMVDTLTNSPGGYSTTPLSNVDFFYNGREHRSMRAVGQVVTAPAGASAIKRVDFDTYGWSAPGVRAEIWGWDGEKPTTQLYAGERQVITETRQAKSWTFAPVPVVGGQQYVLVLSAFDATTTYGYASWVGAGDNGPWDDRYGGGEFVLFEGPDRTSFTTTPWTTFPDSADYDLAFRALFAMSDAPPTEEPGEPEQPQTPPATGGGGSGGGGVSLPAPGVTVTAPSADVPVDAPPAAAEAVVAPSPSTGAVSAPPARRCVVPDVRGKTVSNARRALVRAGCALGQVDGHGTRVIRQSRPGGRSVPHGSVVSVAVRR